MAPPAGNLQPRAQRPLNRIEPIPGKPVRPRDLPPVSSRAQRQIDKAMDLQNAQRFTEAVMELERALRYDPDHPSLHAALACVHWQAGNKKRSGTHAEKAVEGNPDQAMAQYIVACLEADTGNHAAAILACRKAMLCSDFGDDKNVTALTHFQLGASLAEEGYLTAALAQYERFSDMIAHADAASSMAEATQVRTAGALHARASILEHLERYGEAAEVLGQLAATQPEDVALATTRLQLLVRAKQYDKALEAAEAIVVDEPPVLDLIAHAYTLKGNPDGFVGALRQRLSRRPYSASLVLRLADVLAERGDVDQAVSALAAFVDAHPEASDVRRRWVMLLGEHEAWLDAIDACAGEVDRFPGHETSCLLDVLQLAERPRAVEALLRPIDRPASLGRDYLRACVLEAAGRLQPAETLLRACHATDPTFVPARVALARMLRGSNRLQDALRIAQRGDEAVPEDSRLEFELGNIYDQLDDPAAAARHFKAAVQLDRTHVDAMFALAKAQAAAGQQLSAQRQLRDLLEMDPAHGDAAEMLMLSYLTDGKLDEARRVFDALSKAAGPCHATARAKALLDHVDRPDADAYRKTLRASMEACGEDATMWLAIAESYDEFQQEQARSAFEAALAIEPENEDAILGLIRAEQRLLLFEQAAERLRKLLPRRPNRHAWRLRLIHYLWITQDYDAVLSLAEPCAYDEQLDEDTRDLYRSALLDTLRLREQEEEVFKRIQTWADSAAPDSPWKLNLAEAYIQRGDTAKGIELYAAAYAQTGDLSAALTGLASAYVADGNPTAALQLVLDLLEEDPENPGTLMLMLTTLASADMYDAGLELVANELAEAPRREPFQDVTMQLLRLAKRYEQANRYTERLLDVTFSLLQQGYAGDVTRPVVPPEDAPTAQLPDGFTVPHLEQRLQSLRLGLIEGLFLSSAFREAQDLLEAWLGYERDPALRVGYLSALASCQVALGQSDASLVTLERALLLGPEDVRLNNDLAYGFANRGIRLIDAERMIRFAVARSPRQAAYLDTLGWVMYKKGLFVDAVKWLTRAAGASGGDDPVVCDHLGDALWRSGAHQAAILQWEAALALIKEAGDAEPGSDDEQLVRQTTPTKIEEAKAGRVPPIAPLGEGIEVPDQPDNG